MSEGFLGSSQSGTVRVANCLIFTIKKVIELAGIKNCFCKYQKYKNAKIECNVLCIKVIPIAI